MQYTSLPNRAHLFELFRAILDSGNICARFYGMYPTKGCLLISNLGCHNIDSYRPRRGQGLVDEYSYEASRLRVSSILRLLRILFLILLSFYQLKYKTNQHTSLKQLISSQKYSNPHSNQSTPVSHDIIDELFVHC